MEKVVILEASGSYASFYEGRVNDLLEDGWTVKSVNTVANKDVAAIVFVLEKKEVHL
jgi:hypothetical protein